MQRRAITILTYMVSANHWYAEDKFYRGINSYDTAYDHVSFYNYWGGGGEGGGWRVEGYGFSAPKL